MPTIRLPNMPGRRSFLYHKGSRSSPTVKYHLYSTHYLSWYLTISLTRPRLSTTDTTAHYWNSQQCAVSYPYTTHTGTAAEEDIWGQWTTRWTDLVARATRLGADPETLGYIDTAEHTHLVAFQPLREELQGLNGYNANDAQGRRRQILYSIFDDVSGEEDRMLVLELIPVLIRQPMPF
ncbi:hypothetical protein F5144DRAFT_651073 [Chaetomium tenue]|uniref:Uncharacterized protein n=1 Tax=Chaetomium tenue TaxID=1854479 RepID=A0ACB7P9T5_9PEZI|nr:hypothetical protein F5144DRAFT_651073 [Chaetomium globosum]